MSFQFREDCRRALSRMGEEWTDDAVLYAPYQNEQALIDQYADTLAVRAFLKMANLPFNLEQRPNAEYMSPAGIPFLRLQDTLVAEFSTIVDLVGKKGIKLSSDLSASIQADIQAYCSLIDETLRNAERYLSWADEGTYQMVTKSRHGSVFLFPLNRLLPILKRREMLKYLKDIGWTEIPIPKVIGRCEKCFHALSVKLGQQKFFMGDQPTELDALAFGHLYTILTTEMPLGEMVEALKKYPNLIAFCKNVDQEYFSLQQS